MAEKKTKCAKKCAKKPAEKAVEAVKSAPPTKKEAVKIANTARKAQAAYSAALVDLADALISRGAIKSNSQEVKKLAKASELEAGFLQKVSELGY